LRQIRLLAFLASSSGWSSACVGRLRRRGSRLSYEIGVLSVGLSGTSLEAEALRVPPRFEARRCGCQVPFLPRTPFPCFLPATRDRTSDRGRKDGPKRHESEAKIAQIRLLDFLSIDFPTVFSSCDQERTPDPGCKTIRKRVIGGDGCGRSVLSAFLASRSRTAFPCAGPASLTRSGPGRCCRNRRVGPVWRRRDFLRRESRAVSAQ